MGHQRTYYKLFINTFFRGEKKSKKNKKDKLAAKEDDLLGLDEPNVDTIAGDLDNQADAKLTTSSVQVFIILHL